MMPLFVVVGMTCKRNIANTPTHSVADWISIEEVLGLKRSCVCSFE